ncbi:hypothetical protein BJX63DRAFT_134886 [Aspergillus granulosus]|uniref:Uncharacterized protein n=1 Tax=Aspergillus granulosus TaxID=176169 RepID=A0ABR4HMJ6_9EURO
MSARPQQASVPLLNSANTNSGPIPFPARRLELDWNISAALDSSPKPSSPRPWKVLLLSNDIGGGEYTIYSGYLFNGLEKHTMGIASSSIEYCSLGTFRLKCSCLYENFSL